MPALPGLGSLSGQRAAPVAAHPGSAVGPVHSSPRGSAVLNTSSKVLNTARYSIRLTMLAVVITSLETMEVDLQAAIGCAPPGTTDELEAVYPLPYQQACKTEI